MADINNIPMVLLEGTSKRCGQIYGETRKTGILSHIEKWKTYIETSNKMDPDKYIEQFLEETNLLKAVKRWTPQVLEEVEGIAEGAGIDFKTIFALQLPDEEWWYHREKTGLEFSGIGANADHCSSIGVHNKNGGSNFVAENLDVPGYFDGHQVLLHKIDSETHHEEMIFSADGMVALAGMNNHGIGICCNALLQLNHSKDGLPVAFVIRGVLSRKNLINIIDFVYRVKHASGQNYIIGDQNRVIGLECSANKVSQQLPDRETSTLCHTNHPLVNDDVQLSSILENLAKIPDSERVLSDSEIRYNSLENMLNNSQKPIGVSDIKSILSSHDMPKNPICRHKVSESGAMTLGSLIMELSDIPTLFLSPNPPCTSTLSAFNF